MEPKPVVECPSPRYPTQQQVAEDRRFLEKNMPWRWHLIGAASIALAMGFNVCGAEQGGVTDTSTVEQRENVRPWKLLVAPVFLHGEGRGAIGCMAANPPVFLSEDEAMTVIKEELLAHGIHLDRAPTTLPEVEITTRRMTHVEIAGEYRTEVTENRGERQPLVLTGMDSERRIGIKLVGQSTYYQCGGAQECSSVSCYDMVGVARGVTAQVKRKAKQPLVLGVFYDPMCRGDRSVVTETEWKTDWEKAWKKADAAGRAQSRELLRQQVQDFAKWLKEQKAL